MSVQNGAQLSQALRKKAAEFRRLTEGIDENVASRPPSGHALFISLDRKYLR